MAKKGKKKEELTHMQEAFCENVVFLGMSYYRAYIEAGYSANGSRATVSKNAFLLAHEPKIEKRIAELSEQALRNKEHVYLMLIQYYERLLESPDAKESDKLKASELLCKMFGLLQDNINVGAKDDMQIQFNIKVPDKEGE